MRKNQIACGLLGAFFALCAAASLAEPLPYPTGRIDVRTAVVVYNPVISNCFEGAHGGLLSEEREWGNPTNTVENVVNWWRQCSRGMVNIEIKGWTNLYAVFPSDKGYRPAVKDVFAAAVARKEKDMGAMDYLGSLTNDTPWVWKGLKDGELDMVFYVIYPFGPWANESKMFGAGASWFNAGGGEAPLDRCFFSVMPTSERQDTPMENFGHAFESIMANYYANGGDWGWHPEFNEWSLFTRQISNTNANFTQVGFVHYAPNTPRDYLWGESKLVYSYAPGWLRYPDMLKVPPTKMNARYWGGGVNPNHKQWLFYHAPQRYGLYRGHLMNWLTYLFNLNTAAYPLEPGATLSQEIDPRGWCNFQVHAPAGTTAIVFRVQSPDTVLHSGVRKTYIPKRYRMAQEGKGKAWDLFTEPDEQSNDKTWTLTGGDLEGDWFLTCGGAKPVEKLCQLAVTAEVLPRPVPEPLAVAVEMPEAVNGDEAQIRWTATAPACGLRGVELSYSESGPEGPFTPFCHDFAFQLKSPYRWFLPQGSSPAACVKVEIEDCFGRKTAAVSRPFALNQGREWQMYDVPGTDDAWGDRAICSKAGSDGKDFYFSKANVKDSPFFRRSGETWQRLADLPCGRRDNMTPFVPFQGGLLTEVCLEDMDAQSNRVLTTAFAYYSPARDAWRLGKKARRGSTAALAVLENGTVFLAEEDGDIVRRLVDWKSGRSEGLKDAAPGGRSCQWAAATDGQTAYFAKFNGAADANGQGVLLAVDKEGNQTVLPPIPFNPGLGCSLAYVPGRLAADGHARLYLVRGGRGYRRPWAEQVSGRRFNVDCHEDNLGIFDLEAGSWTVETLPVPTDEASRLVLVGDRLYLLGAANIHMPLRIKELKAN